MTKVTIVSGFLGAGKTTFIKELIGKVWPGEKLVLIENEFGEMGIDSRFMRGADIQVTEMNSGCICCTLAGDFAEALQDVTARWAPDRILIEPSGVAKLSEVSEAVLSVQHVAGLEPGGRITVVDGKKAAMYLRNFNAFFRDQIEYADTLVISRTQKMEEHAVRDCVDLLRKYNKEAPVITTPWEELDGEAIAGALECRPGPEEAIHCHHHHQDNHDHSHHHHHDHQPGHHHADEVFVSWSVQTVHRFRHSELEDILRLLAMTEDFGVVLRAKGIVEGEDGSWMEFDMTPQETELRECPADYTGRICVIGTELNTGYLEQVFGK